MTNFKRPPIRAEGSRFKWGVSPLYTAMNYQLVFQFRGDSLADFDAMVALEDELIARLGGRFWLL